ncbi:CapA family protein [Haloferax larsenii]|uniref:Poly-gamma-glutamate synthesis protein (Capsule biosynthesis protein) n=1 Tax=Haloferax larsenii TaxID=302484 RepID=A0A1H7SMB2_HALLR|nr:CapA family protein [Haloferax larsenii]SEL73752.1 poly-gamma-glutamate synthesis protein (capsule biosynthesis protein) [Haloferax larsenii]
MTETIRLGFTGDVMLGRLVNERQQHRPPNAVWGSMREPLQSLDGLFVNLECCLSTRGQQWQRTYRPFHFRADPDWAIPALQDVGVTWVTLANNHVLDFEEVALEDTFDALEEAEIPYAGAGRTEVDAWEPSHVQVAGLDVALVAFTDNTPEYAADGESPGTAHVPIDPDDDAVLEQVEAALGSARTHDPDVLVASLHWGPNKREHPPQSFQDFAHWLVERGVDILHGHSAHVFQGVEVYDDSVILYDTGDFVDDYAVDETLRNDRSFLFEVRVSSEGDVHDLCLHPTEIGELAVHRASPPVAQWCRTRLRERSSSFGTRFERVDDGLRVEIRE